MSSTSNKLHLNRRHGIFGGVCAGLADYFDIDRLIVRIIAIIAALTWWPTFVVYIVLYFVLSDKKPTLSEMGENISNSKVGKHFKHVNYRKRIYKNRRDKKISGVCAGIANYLEISPFIVRAIALLSLFFGPFAIIAYIIAAIIMDTNPDDAEFLHSRRDQRRQRRHQRRQRRRGRDHDDIEDYEPKPRQSYERPFDKRDIKEATAKFSDLEKKLQDLEATITSNKFKLHGEFKRMAT